MAALALVEPRSIHELTREALTEAHGNTDRACELLATWLTEEPQARDELIRFGVRQYVQQVVRKQRTRMIHRGGPGVPAKVMPEPADVTGLTALALHNLLDYPLTGTLKLRDAKKQDVLDAAQVQFAMARRLSDRGRWFSLIADHVPYGKCVADVLSDGQLRALQVKAAERGV